MTPLKIFGEGNRKNNLTYEKRRLAQRYNLITGRFFDIYFVVRESVTVFAFSYQEQQATK